MPAQVMELKKEMEILRDMLSDMGWPSRSCSCTKKGHPNTLGYPNPLATQTLRAGVVFSEYLKRMYVSKHHPQTVIGKGITAYQHGSRI